MSEKNQPPTPELTSPRLERLLNAAARIEQEIALERATLARLNRLEDDCRVASARTVDELVPFVKHTLPVVMEQFSVTREDVFGPTRQADVLDARHVLMWVARTHTGASYPTLGRVFGRDHTSIISACRRVDDSPRLNEAAHRVITQMHVTRIAESA